MLSSNQKTFLFSQLDQTLPRQSRIHQLPSGRIPSFFIKREDELSGSIPGSKLRKYLSLLPFLDRSEISHLGIVGGPNSNNIVGLLQILRERGIEPWLFLRQPADASLKGNALLIDLLAPAAEKKVLIPRDQWDNVLPIARETFSKLTPNPSFVYILPEGALAPECLVGSLTLADDILRNESDSQQFFSRLYVDSGSGASAMGLLLGLALFDANCDQREVIITLIAGNEAEFRANLDSQIAVVKTWLPDFVPTLPRIRFLEPTTAPHFGSVNATTLQACKSIAAQEGILMDPIYSVKHFLAASADMESAPIENGLALFINNSNPLGLLGFQDQLAAQA